MAKTAAEITNEIKKIDIQVESLEAQREELFKQLDELEELKWLKK